MTARPAPTIFKAASGTATPVSTAARDRSQRPSPQSPIALRDLEERPTEDTWRQSSFDLAQGLEVKELKSKHSSETLDQLFGRR